MIPVMLLVGIVIELVVLRTLYDRDHMDQVLATFGLILFFNELVRIIWGVEAQPLTLPMWLSGNVEILPDAPYPVYRLVVIGVGMAVAAGLFWMITKTRMGMLIRAGASNRPMVGALGVNIRFLYTMVFGLGAVFAGLAGLMAAPLQSVESGIGEDMLIFAFVVIVIGGIGSIRGALVASIVIGIFEDRRQVYPAGSDAGGGGFRNRPDRGACVGLDAGLYPDGGHIVLQTSGPVPCADGVRSCLVN